MMDEILPKSASNYITIITTFATTTFAMMQIIKIAGLNSGENKLLSDLDLAPLLMFRGVIESVAVAGNPPKTPEIMFANPTANTFTQRL